MKIMIIVLNLMVIWLSILWIYMQIYGRWQSHIYQIYVQAADSDRKEWEDIKEEDEEDPIRTNFDILFGHL